MPTDKESKTPYPQECDLSLANENLMLKRLLTSAEVFYQRPEKVEAFNKWIAERREPTDEMT